MSARRLGLLLALATALAFAPVLGHRFLAFDDGLYVLDNPPVLAGLTAEGVRWAFTSWEYGSFWHPLTWLSHMLDVELFGVEGERFGLPASGWHHLVSLVLHVANALLLFAFLRRATGATRRSFLVAALFALHPLHVESVAWVAERKDVLSTLFGFGCLLAYVRYAERPSAGRYLAVLVLLALGLAAKPMLVTWPFLLLLLDWWPLGRFAPAGPAPAVEPGRAAASAPPAGLVLEKLPLFLLVGVASALSFLAQRGVAMHLMERLPLSTRLENALVSYLRYLAKTLWPADLAPQYPYREWPTALVAIAVILLAGITAFAFRNARRRPWAFVGWCWFLGTLVPVLGIVQVGLHAMADRYTYVPLVGLFVAVAWGLGELGAARPSLRPALQGAAAAALAVCALLTWSQARLWRDTVTLFRHVCAVTEDNGWAHRILGTALAAEGRSGEAIVEFERALAYWPDDPIAHNNLGRSLADEGRAAEALRAYREAVRLAPADATYRGNLASLLARQGDLQGSVEHFEEALRLEPDSLQAHVNLGKSLALLGRMDGAARHFGEATRLEPGSVAAWNNLAAALAATGRLAEAADAAAEALRLARASGESELAELLAARLEEYRRQAAGARTGSGGPPR